MIYSILAMLNRLNFLPQGGKLVLVKTRAVPHDSFRQTILSLLQRLRQLLLEYNSPLLSLQLYLHLVVPRQLGGVALGLDLVKDTVFFALDLGFKLYQ